MPGTLAFSSWILWLVAAAAQQAAPAPARLPSDTAVAPRTAAINWPAFRGNAASGVGDGQGAVVEWDVATGKNVRWKTPIPGMANASPIIWGNRIYVATAISASGDTTFLAGISGNIRSHDDVSEQTWRLYALDTQTGRIVWDKEVHKGVPLTKRHAKASHAASTPVTDGKRIVVLFGTVGVLAAYDLNGEQLWKKSLGVIDSGYVVDPAQQWGYSASPLLYQNSVIVQADQQKGSYIAAFDLSDGRELWRTPREDEISSWSTPAIATGRAGDELITNGTKIRGYDPRTGQLRWTLGPNSQIAIPTPVVGGELVYVAAGYQPVRPVYAIRPGATGDLTLAAGATSSASIPWSVNRDGPYIPTPILYRGLLYSLNNNGVLAVFDAQTGEQALRGRVGAGGAFSASPVAADGRIYYANEDGQVFVTRAGREYLEIVRNDMTEPVTATPAISNGLLVIRTVRAVYGIGQN
jgi:outer membrane protein assembly factor BamB